MRNHNVKSIRVDRTPWSWGKTVSPGDTHTGLRVDFLLHRRLHLCQYSFFLLTARLTTRSTTLISGSV